MKPAPFDYHRASTLGEALELLNQSPHASRILAGGQSLVPLLNMRLARPEVLVDINAISELRSVEMGDAIVRIGSMVRQRTLETDPRIKRQLPVVAQAVSHIAHLAIRTRGTIGGSLAHADPAAELPAVMLLLDATIVVAGLAGLRRMPASDFFLGPFTTALLPGEILHSVELAPRPGPGAAFTEVSRVHGAFALVGAGALVNLAADDGIAKAEVVLFAVGDRPQRIDWLPEATVGRRLDERLLDELADRIAAWVSPLEDIHAGTEYRRRVSGRLAVRALQTAAHAASVR